jgi:hypothetical protein
MAVLDVPLAKAPAPNAELWEAVAALPAPNVELKPVPPILARLPAVAPWPKAELKIARAPLEAPNAELLPPAKLWKPTAELLVPAADADAPKAVPACSGAIALKPTAVELSPVATDNVPHASSCWPTFAFSRHETGVPVGVTVWDRAVEHVRISRHIRVSAENSILLIIVLSHWLE